MNIDPDVLSAIAQRLADHAGLELPQWVIEARASERMAALAMSSTGYAALLGSPRGDHELAQLTEAVRVGESRLFRHRQQLAALVDHIVPRLAGRRSVRVWSAGCAAGEEPYTLAAILSRALPTATLSIIATDVSASALASARGASYPRAAWQDIPEPWRDGFELVGEQVRVRREVAQLVRFEQANLADPNAPGPRDCDLVWCRNVLIYFTEQARQRALGRIVAATRPGGWVFVGYSESLRDVGDLEAVRAGDAVYYTRVHAARRRRTSERRAASAPDSHAAIARGSAPIATPAPARSAVPPSQPALARDREQIVSLHGRPAARQLTDELTARLAISELVRLVIDLDRAELLGDELAPVLRRAIAAARSAHIELVLRAQRTGPRRWIARHDLESALEEER